MQKQDAWNVWMYALISQAFLSACSQSENGKISAPEPIFGQADLTQGEVRPLDSAALVEQLHASPGFYAGNATVGVADARDPCLVDKVGHLLIEADKANLIVRGKVDIKDCIQQAPEGSPPFTQVSLDVMQWYGCKDADLSRYDGKAFSIFLQDESSGRACPVPGESSRLYNLVLNAQITGKIQTETKTQQTKDAALELDLQIVTALQNRSGKACTGVVLSDRIVWRDDCVYVAKTRTTRALINGRDAHDTREDYLQLGFKGVEESLDFEARFYLNGQFNVVLNNWRGTMQYSGAQQAAAYSLSDGISEVAGQIGEAEKEDLSEAETANSSNAEVNSQSNMTTVLQRGGRSGEQQAVKAALTKSSAAF